MLPIFCQIAYFVSDFLFYVRLPILRDFLFFARFPILYKISNFMYDFLKSVNLIYLMESCRATSTKIGPNYGGSVEFRIDLIL